MIKCIVICLLLPIVISTEPQFSVGDLCSLVDSNFGECRKDTDCPSFREFIKDKNNLRFIKTRFNKCGYKGFNQIICCPEFEIPDVPSPNVNPVGYTGNNVEPVVNPEPVENPEPDLITRLSDRVCEIQCKRYIEDLPAKVGPDILEGTATEIGEFGHMAALGYFFEGKFEYRCGGSLISENYVLTAAHCLVRSDGLEPSIVRVGTIFLNDTSGLEMTIEEIIPHPNYKLPQLYNDIGLIKLSDKIDITAYAHPACLSVISPRSGLLLSATGWGLTDIRRSAGSSILLKINLTITSEAECVQEYTEARDKKAFPNGILKSQTCAIDRRPDVRGDTCQGDSGGPLQGLSDPKGMYTIFGVTSLGRVCGEKAPAVYTKVSEFVEWIEKIVWR